MSLVYVDSETFPIARAQLAPKLVCVQWKDSVSHGILRRADALHKLAEWFSGNDVLVGVNIAFDVAVFAAYFPSLLPYIFAKYARDEIIDLGVAQKLVDIAYGKPQDSYSAEALCERYGLPSDKQNEWRTRFGELDGLDPSEYPREAREYALYDVVFPAKIYPQIREQAAKFEARMGSPVLHVAPQKSRAAFSLHLKSCWGVHSNPTRTRAFRRATEKVLAKYHTRLKRCVLDVHHPNTKKWGKSDHGTPIGPDGMYRGALLRADDTMDDRAARAYMARLSARRGFDMKLTDSGAPSCDKDASERSGSYVLQARCEYNSADKLLGRVAALEAGHDYPLQCSWDPILVTGRTSCWNSRQKRKSDPMPVLRGTQLQNPSRAGDERGCYEPWDPEGWRFFDADFPSAELHALAEVQIRWFGKSKLADLLNGGKDVLLWFGATVLNGIPYEKAVELKRAGDPRIKDMRQMAKAYIYGLPGGLGAAKMVTYARTNYKVILTEKQARRDKETWMDALDMGPYFAKINKTLGGRETGFMLHPVSGFWRGGAYFCDLCNSPFQSLTAFGATDADFHVSHECYVDHGTPLFGARPWAFIHDQILAMAPTEQCPEAADRLGELMTEVYNRWTPNVPIKPGKTEGCVMRVWSKAAEPVRDGVTKRLVPWEPCAGGCKKGSCVQCVKRAHIVKHGLEDYNEKYQEAA